MEMLKCRWLLKFYFKYDLCWGFPGGSEMTTHPSILAWRFLWTEEPGGLQSVGSQEVGHDLAIQQWFVLKLANLIKQNQNIQVFHFRAFEDK